MRHIVVKSGHSTTWTFRNDSVLQACCKQIADLQPYARRNVLCISNPACPETTDENTDNLVLQLSSSQLNVGLQPWELYRSHKVGKPQPGKIRPIWVKFIGYCSRDRLFKACKLLKGLQTIGKVCINKDLTTITYEKNYKARQLKHFGAIAETFISDCKVFAKKFASDNIVLIKNEFDPIDIALSSFSQALNQVEGSRRSTYGTQTRCATWFSIAVRRSTYRANGIPHFTK